METTTHTVTPRRLQGTIAVVTGASSGIGAATTTRLAREGAHVFATGRHEARLRELTEGLREEGLPDVTWACADLTEPGSGDDIVARAREWAGAPTAVINCAGSFPSASIAEMTDAAWDEALALNLTAPMRVIRAAVPHMRPGGVTVVVSSINAHLGDAASLCGHYAAAKAALEGLTRQLAVELAPRGIRAVGVAPGAVATPMLEGWNAGPGEMEAWLERYVPLRRIASPEEIAGVIAFLVSPDASYVTGQVVLADGGMAVV